ncbi:hypothetical protein [Legionella shakespearei]|uniref:Uncharacterized protein n=1 Tax=Legionella shakespearei DSM 23087 TaxID=1122169 RepID=A0A0W0Z670_9GAMM|nr:hypothetical protein [Legionella shakespearei]KTD64609.1 hypothetical protein Lsha_0548 [Legionella shakespearei DSM 23087]
MKHYLHALGLVCALSSGFAYSGSYQQMNSVTPTIAGSPLFQDSFGQVIHSNGDYLFVAAPIARPDPAKQAEGAVYVYKKQGNSWVFSQVLTTSGWSDHLGVFRLATVGKWLFVSGIGTPIGPNRPDGQPDEATNQDFTGSIQIYKRNNAGQYQFSQALDRTTPGLEQLSVIDPAALENPQLPPRSHESGAAFGMYFDVDKNGKRLLVSASGQEFADVSGTMINAGAIYSFEMKNNKWVLKQTLRHPVAISTNGSFGGRVRIAGNFAVISDTDTLQNLKLDHNSSVFLYKYNSNTHQWNHIDTVHGDQPANGLLAASSFVFGGVTDPNIMVGDNFGGSLAFANKWVLVGAPYENLSSDKPHGAAYMYHIEKVNGQHKLVFKKKFVSDDPDSLLTGINVSVSNKVALVGDPAHSGPNGETAQGAVMVYERHGNNWSKDANLFDQNGSAYQMFGNGTEIHGNKLYGGTGTAVFTLNMAFLFTPAYLPNVPVPLQANKVVEWKRSGN